MTPRGFARGSRASRGAGRRTLGWATGGSLLWLWACSGSTDVVGVFDPLPTDVAPAPLDSDGERVNAQSLQRVGGSEEDSSEFLVVAGLPLRDWQKPAVPWPLGVPLRVFFSTSSWPDRSGPPDHVEREAFERMGVFSEDRQEDVRFVAPTGDAAERLRLLFSRAPEDSHGEPLSLVARDDLSDEYKVVLGSASCGHTSNHHGGPCPDPAGNGSADP